MISNRIIKSVICKVNPMTANDVTHRACMAKWGMTSYLHLVFLYYIFPSCGICGGQSDIGTNCTIESFGFLVSFPGAPHSRFIHVINNWYNKSLWLVLIFPYQISCGYSIFRMHVTCIVLSSTSKSYEQKVMWKPLLHHHHHLISVRCPVTTSHLGQDLTLNQFVASTLNFYRTWAEGVDKNLK